MLDEKQEYKLMREGETCLLSLLLLALIRLRVRVKVSIPDVKDTLTNIFTYILKMFNNLHYLNFEASSVYHQQVSFSILPPNIFS
jgi:hypothetical protein